MKSHKEEKVFSYFNTYLQCVFLFVKIWFEIGLKVERK